MSQNHIIYDEIEAVFSQNNSDDSKFVFIRALVMAVCCSCFSELNQLNETKFIDLCELLSMYIKGNAEHEIEALYALSAV